MILVLFFGVFIGGGIKFFELFFDCNLCVMVYTFVKVYIERKNIMYVNSVK